MSRDDAPPKSAYELAMERLNAQDRAAGVEKRPLNDDQKRRIAECRSKAKANLAELEILRDKSVAEAAGDPEKLAEIHEHFEIDRKRVEGRVEDHVARIRDEA